MRGLASYVVWATTMSVGILLLRPLALLLWLACTVLALLCYPRLGPARWRRRRAAMMHLRPVRQGFRGLTAGYPFLLVGLVLLQLAYTRYTGWPPAQLTYRYAAEPLGALAVLAVMAVVAPLVEEFAFRGQLQGRASRTLGPWIGGALGAAFFAAAHWNPALLPYFFLNGAVFAYLFVQTGSIWSCVLAHGAVNAGMTALGPTHGWVVAHAAAVPSVVLGLCSAMLLATAVYLFTPCPKRERRHPGRHPGAAPEVSQTAV